jgi:phthalate 4,5-cis-dihydrodiol dehydrogenase
MLQEPSRFRRKGMAATETSKPETTPGSRRPLKVGIIGIGVGATEVLPSMESMPEIDLMAGADIVPETRERFQKRYPETRVYESAEQLCADSDVEAVWVSSPNRWHAPHTILAAQHGKHVVVEKPMALSIEQGVSMIEACQKAGVKLLAGHTRSFGAPIRTIRKIVNSGKLGRLTAMNMWAYTDWMLRPRTWEELDLEQGGGIPYRQGPHQIDTVRFIGGGMLRSVRGMSGQWLPARSIPGYYGAYLEFEDGTPTTIVHNGYGNDLGADQLPGGESSQR